MAQTSIPKTHSGPPAGPEDGLLSVTFRTDPSEPCRTCGVEMSAATGFADNRREQPSAGAFSVCAYCNTVSVFTEVLGGLRRRAPTPEEHATFNEQHGERLRAFQRENAGRLRRLRRRRGVV